MNRKDAMLGHKKSPMQAPGGQVGRLSFHQPEFPPSLTGCQAKSISINDTADTAARKLRRSNRLNCYKSRINSGYSARISGELKGIAAPGVTELAHSGFVEDIERLLGLAIATGHVKHAGAFAKCLARDRMGTVA